MNLLKKIYKINFKFKNNKFNKYIMKIVSTMLMSNLLDYGFKYVIKTSNKYNIDESHALKHSMEVYNFAKKIYNSEIISNTYLENHKEIIYLSAIGHDMCDKKYMDEKEGIKRYKNYLSEFINPSSLDIIGQIIGTMSYSKVKVNGFPELGEYQLAYNIVREADLLASYDVDRCIMYAMYHDNCNYSEGLLHAIGLFETRVFNMRKDKLFKTKYSKRESLKLHKKAKMDIINLQK